MIEPTPTAAPRIRPAALSDYADFARLSPELGADWPVPEEAFWAAEMAAKTWLAEHEGRVVGYLVGEADGTRGFVHQLVSDPAVRRQGVARALLLAHAERLRAQGCTTWQLYVEGSNTAARALYRSVGLLQVGRRVSVAIDRGVAAALPSDAGIHAADVAPALDDAITTFGAFAAGTMRWFRSRGRPLVALEQRGEPVGFCLHVPAYALVRPIVLTRAEALPPLLSALGGKEGRLTLVIEDRGEGTVERLLAAGGVQTGEEFLCRSELGAAR